jgi:hypothetical protein
MPSQPTQAVEFEALYVLKGPRAAIMGSRSTVSRLQR